MESSATANAKASRSLLVLSPLQWQALALVPVIGVENQRSDRRTPGG